MAASARNCGKDTSSVVVMGLGMTSRHSEITLIICIDGCDRHTVVTQRRLFPSFLLTHLQGIEP
jgi:hypothetical protein